MHTDGMEMVMEWDDEQALLARTLTDDEFRATGFTGAARQYPRSLRGFRWICEFNGATTDNAPKTWRFASNKYMLDYVEAKADEHPSEP